MARAGPLPTFDRPARAFNPVFTWTARRAGHSGYM